jgi:hypothetical protein
VVTAMKQSEMRVMDASDDISVIDDVLSQCSSESCRLTQ